MALQRSGLTTRRGFAMRESPEYLEGAIEMNRILLTNLSLRGLPPENIVVAGAPIAKDATCVKGVFLVKRKLD
jgi:hypothetical protein